MMLGTTIPMMTLAFSVIYGMTQINLDHEIKRIEYVKGGEHEGWLQISIQKGFISR